VSADPRSWLPSLTVLLELEAVAEAVATHGRDRVLAALRDVLARARDEAATAEEVPTAAEVAAAALDRVAREGTRSLRPVINATGVVLHTNLGRAPLSDAAIAAMTRAAGTTNLEFDLATGHRGGRDAVVRSALARLTGAEAALVVNNGAAALVLALAVLAREREVVISRGELVEIGGSFRLPEIMRTAGAVLHEIGTTNRTHLADYRDAMGPRTGAVLRVHPSNYSVEGFSHRPGAREIAEVAHEQDVPFVHDIGSGLLRPHPAAPDEPTAAASLGEGADLVVFSGDKLLGGPQAGVVAGRADLVERCRRDPLARTQRLDKLRLAALEATLSSHERDAAEELPIWAMVGADAEGLRVRAERIAAACGGTSVEVAGLFGGGSAPGARLPSWGVALPGPTGPLIARLRAGDPPVVARVVDDRVVADLRAVPADLDAALTAVLAGALGTDPPDGRD
jgi:L-seryl-tRNA(Ser) seleniumtransferase